MKRTLGRYFPGAILLALVSILSPTSAYASVIAKVSNSTTHSVTSGTFKVAPQTAAQTTQICPLPAVATTGVKTIPTGSNGLDFFYCYLNTGTLALAGFTRTITLVAGNGTGSTFDSCPVGKTYNNSTQCSDLSTPITLSLTGTGPALLVGQWLPIHIFVSKSTATYTVSSTVTNSQIRTATNTTA